MSNDQIIYDDERSNDAEMMEMLAEFQYLKSEEAYTKWVYENARIGNGNDLVEALENTEMQQKYLRDMGLPLDTELEL